MGLLEAGEQARGGGDDADGGGVQGDAAQHVPVHHQCGVSALGHSSGADQQWPAAARPPSTKSPATSASQSPASNAGTKSPNAKTHSPDPAHAAALTAAQTP